MESSKITHRQLLKCEDLITCLEDLASGIRAGKVIFERNGQFVTLRPPGTVHLDLEAKEKKGKGEISIEITWRNDVEEATGAPLVITSEEPEISEKPE